MKTEQQRVIRKRALNGATQRNVFFSTYMPSYKYAVITLIEPTETHLGGVNIQTFKTKKECELSNPKHPSMSFEDFEMAKEFFNAYGSLQIEEYTFPKFINVIGGKARLQYVVDESLDPNWESDGIWLHSGNLHAKYK